jgi:hypothetical protein
MVSARREQEQRWLSVDAALVPARARRGPPGGPLREQGAARRGPQRRAADGGLLHERGLVRRIHAIGRWPASRPAGRGSACPATRSSATTRTRWAPWPDPGQLARRQQAERRGRSNDQERSRGTPTGRRAARNRRARPGRRRPVDPLPHVRPPLPPRNGEPGVDPASGQAWRDPQRLLQTTGGRRRELPTRRLRRAPRATPASCLPGEGVWRPGRMTPSRSNE